MDSSYVSIKEGERKLKNIQDSLDISIQRRENYMKKSKKDKIKR